MFKKQDIKVGQHKMYQQRQDIDVTDSGQFFGRWFGAFRDLDFW